MCQAVICARAQLLLWGGSSVVLLLLKADGVLLCYWPTAGGGASWLAAGVGLLLVLLSLSLDRLAAAWWSAFQYQRYQKTALGDIAGRGGRRHPNPSLCSQGIWTAQDGYLEPEWM